MAPRSKRAASPTTRADASTALATTSKRARRTRDDDDDDDANRVTPAARDGAISLRAPARRGAPREGGRTSSLAAPIMALSNAHRGAGANAIAFSRDGKTLASGGSDKTTALWRTSDGARGNTN